jgi:prepilin-type N-terminal cleavage/methylation domain-containing protein
LRGFSRNEKQDSEASTRRAEERAKRALPFLRLGIREARALSLVNIHSREFVIERAPGLEQKTSARTEARTRFPASNPPNLPLDVSSITRSGKLEVYNKKTRGNNAGFTLVEVIVVIVIIAILAAIGVPALTGYIDKANQRKLTAMGKEAMTAMQSVIVENYLNKEVNGSEVIFHDNSFNYYIFSGDDEDGDGVYEATRSPDGSYEYTDTEDPSTYEGVSGFYGEMWKLTKIPLVTFNDKAQTLSYIAHTSQGQILAYLMFDPYHDIEDGGGRMVGYNISSDTNYINDWDYGTNTLPSYDPDAGFSYWKVKEDGKTIEPW